MKINILACLICLTLFSCSRESELYQPDRLIEVENDYDVKSKSCQVIDTLVQNIGGAYSIDNYLIVLTNNSGSLINVYDVRNDKKIASFGDKGNAKNEFGDSFWHSYVTKYPNGEIMLNVSQAAGTITKVINVNKSIKHGKCCLERIIKHTQNNASTFSRPYFFGDNSYICYKEVSYDDPRDNIFYAPNIICSDKGKIKTKCVFPKTIKTDYLNNIFCAYSFTYSVRPDFKKSVNAMKFIDIINFVDTHSLEVIGVCNKLSVDMSYFESDINESNLTKKIKLYNIAICSSNEKVFVLKTNGVSIQDIYDKKPFNKFIFVYDWDGNLLDSFEVKEELAYIAYNEKYNMLYGISDEGIIVKMNYMK